MHLGAQGVAVDAEDAGGPHLVPPALHEHLADQGPLHVGLHLVQQVAPARLAIVLDRGAPGPEDGLLEGPARVLSIAVAHDIAGQVGQPDQVGGGGDHQALHHVFQLAHVARPSVAGERPGGLRRQRAGRQAQLPHSLAQEMVDEQRDILRSLAQRGAIDDEGADAVKEVVAERTPCDLFAQVLVGRGQDAGGHPQGFRAPHPLELQFLQHPQQLCLQLEGEVADLVEQQGAAARLLDAADLALLGSREGAALVAEQLGLQQVAGDRRTVHRHEGPAGPRGVMMDRVGDEFLARPALAQDQHGQVAVRDAPDGLVDFPHRAALADDGLLGSHLLQGRRGRGGMAPGDANCLNGALDERFDLVDVEGLDQVIERPQLHGGDGVLHGALAGDDGHQQIGEAALLPLQKGPAVVPRQVNIHQGEVDGLVFHEQHRLFRAGGEMQLVSGVAEGLLDHPADAFLVVQHQDPDRVPIGGDGLRFGHGLLLGGGLSGSRSPAIRPVSGCAGGLAPAVASSKTLLHLPCKRIGAGSEPRHTN